jgi:hypothetical protein
LVQAFLKKWWVESDCKAPNLPLSLRFKGSGCHYNSIYSFVGGRVCQQTFGIPMGINYASLLSDMFHYSYDANFIQGLLKKKQKEASPIL